MIDENVSPHFKKGVKGDNFMFSTATPILLHNMVKLYLKGKKSYV